MGDTEEYLDDLLHSISDESGEEEFLKQFEEELSKDDSTDDFLKQLEETNIDDIPLTDEAETEETETIQDLGSMSVSEDRPEVKAAPEPESTDDNMGNQDDDLMALLSGLAEDPELNAVSGEEPEVQPQSDFAKQETEHATEEEPDFSGELNHTDIPLSEDSAPQDDPFGLSAMDIFGDEVGSALDELKEESIEEQETEEKGKKSKNHKKGDKKEANGLFQKLSLILFGEEEEEEFQTEEELRLEKEEKEKKKKEKAEAKAKKKEENAAKKAEKKANKPKKEKKPKAPKEKDNTPPLPKKPIILMAIMSLSILVLVMLGSSAVGYSVARGEAKSAYKSGDYVTAYSKMAGYEIKEKDEEFFIQTGLLATIQEEYNAYQVMRNLGKNEMALDCLVRGIGRYDRNIDDASEYGIAPEYNALKDQMAAELSNTFGIDEEKAREIYGQRGRKKYTVEIKKVLMSLGME